MSDAEGASQVMAKEVMTTLSFAAGDTALTDADDGAEVSHLDDAWSDVCALPADPDRAPGWPLMPGAVALVGHRGRIRWRRAAGWARCYADRTGRRLDDSESIPMRTDTIFDVASITKLFTSIVIMHLVERDVLRLDVAVVDYLPEFAAGSTERAPKKPVTLRQLLVHTSGFPSSLPLWADHPDPGSRITAVLTAPLVAPPGTVYCYSDLNLIILGELARRFDGRTLDRLVADVITEPLRMADTGYCPDRRIRSRIAATEDEQHPPRGTIWGEVHDENAWSLGGIAGHAGVFSTTADLAVLAQMVINGGSYGGQRILQADTLHSMLSNQVPNFPGDDHGLGFELNQPRYMGRMAGPHTCGHTGFTGTSLVIDIDRQAFVILLTNRVHPSRDWGGINPARVMMADAVADALDTHHTL